MRFAALIALLLAFGPAAAGTLSGEVQYPTTLKGTSTPIPATGPNSLSGAEVTYGSCAANGSILSPKGAVVIAHPQKVFAFGNIPAELYCLQAVFINKAGERSDPVAAMSSLPPAGGEILIVRFSDATP